MQPCKPSTNEFPPGPRFVAENDPLPDPTTDSDSRARTNFSSSAKDHLRGLPLVSQTGQEALALQLLFRYPSGAHKTGGVFVDVGAHDGECCGARLYVWSQKNEVRALGPLLPPHASTPWFKNAVLQV